MGIKAIMSDGRKGLSGSDYRKRSKEKNEKEQEVIKISNKINYFLCLKVLIIYYK